MSTDSMTVEMFPSLSRKTLRKSKFKITGVRAYTSSGETLEVDGNSRLEFDNERGDWTMEGDGLSLRIGISMANARALFEDDGVAGHDSILGVAVTVKSPISCRRDTFDSDIVIDADTETVDSTLVVNLSSADYHGSATLDLVLYVRDGDPEDRFAYERGYILGKLQSYLLSFDGQASMFPIDTIASKDDFLWRLECDYSDVAIDRFDQSVAIVFNEKHPRYRELEIDKTNIGNLGFLSILSHAIQVLIETVLLDPDADKVVSGDGLSEGSVGAAVHYLISVFGNRDDPQELAFEIERYLMEVGRDGTQMENADGKSVQRPVRPMERRVR